MKCEKFDKFDFYVVKIEKNEKNEWEYWTQRFFHKSTVILVTKSNLAKTNQFDLEILWKMTIFTS